MPRRSWSSQAGLHIGDFMFLSDREADRKRDREKEFGWVEVWGDWEEAGDENEYGKYILYKILKG